ncbi:hypothetical protein GW12_13810 [Acinetobacter sp. HR7]|nr:hypothetical protein GW12_13810 [Acinetobacter sp. HR7]
MHRNKNDTNDKYLPILNNKTDHFYCVFFAPKAHIYQVL